MPQYPATPGRRFAIDADGTRPVYMWTGDETTTGISHTDPIGYFEAAGSDVQVINNYDNHVRWGGQTPQAWITDPIKEVFGNDEEAWMVFLFPEARDIDGVYIAAGLAWGSDTASVANREDNIVLQFSSDSTNGVDGTWAGATTPASRPSTYVNGRLLPGPQGIAPQAEVSRRGIRLEMRLRGWREPLNCVHFYGTVAGGETPDRIIWADPTTSLEYTIDYDYEDLPRGTSLDRTVRLLNNSGVRTANTIVIDTQSFEVSGGDYQMNNTNWYTYDIGAGFFASVTVPALAPGAFQDIIIRTIIPDNAIPGIYAPRVRAQVGTWT